MAKGINIAIRRYIEYYLENYPQDLGELELYRDTVDGDVRLFRKREVTNAIKKVLAKQDEETIRLIKLRYWDRHYNLTRAGAEIYLTRDQAYLRINRVIVEIAKELGEV